jgi:hypothetical protein
MTFPLLTLPDLLTVLSAEFPMLELTEEDFTNPSVGALPICMFNLYRNSRTYIVFAISVKCSWGLALYYIVSC